ncbi:MAG: TlpA family protein disulfide reductase [Clostridia bacterium]|nr:TlpA family protein disulfide reductase [Clostridia bacterium]MBQ9409123.1 TlpA family protein disulfide reductase [Clostridia bacterium]
MKWNRFLAFALSLLLLLGMSAFSLAESTPAPDFTVTDADGKQVKLSDKLDGKPVIFNIWASWCPPCVAELGYFDEAAKQYKDKINFMMINLTDGAMETVDGAKAFLEQKGYTFPAYFDTLGEAASLYVGQYIPMTWVINADGTVLGYVEGGMAQEDLLYCINLLIEG